MIKYMPDYVEMSFSYNDDCTIFQQIIDEITDNKVKVRVIDAMELNCRMYGKRLFKYNNQMENIMSFLAELKGYVADYDLYNIEAVKRLEMPQLAAKATDKQPTIQPKLQPIFAKATEGGFMSNVGGKLKWLKSMSYLAIFADVLNEKGFTKTKISEIENLFEVKNLTQYLTRTLSQKNEPTIRAAINKLFA